MTPAAKAKYLYDQLHYQICNDLGQSESDSSEVAAKSSALLCCDEIIEILTPLRGFWARDIVDPINYWQQVKEAIQKL